MFSSEQQRRRKKDPKGKYCLIYLMWLIVFTITFHTDSRNLLETKNKIKIQLKYFHPKDPFDETQTTITHTHITDFTLLWLHFYSQIQEIIQINALGQFNKLPCQLNWLSVKKQINLNLRTSCLFCVDEILNTYPLF